MHNSSSAMTKDIQKLLHKRHTLQNHTRHSGITILFIPESLEWANRMHPRKSERAHLVGVSLAMQANYVWFTCILEMLTLRDRRENVWLMREYMYDVKVRVWLCETPVRQLVAIHTVNVSRDEPNCAGMTV